MEEWVVGIDLGATKIALGLIDPQNRIVARQRVPTAPLDGPDAAVARMAKRHRCAASRLARRRASHERRHLLAGTARSPHGHVARSAQPDRLGQRAAAPDARGSAGAARHPGARCQSRRAGRVSLRRRTRRARHGLHRRGHRRRFGAHPGRESASWAQQLGGRGGAHHHPDDGRCLLVRQRRLRRVVRCWPGDCTHLSPGAGCNG